MRGGELNIWPVLAATWSAALAAFPLILIGALAVSIRGDLQFDEAKLGIVAGVFWAASALSSVSGGRLSERLGPDRALRFGASGSFLVLMLIAGVAYSWYALALFMGVAGVLHGLVQPATDLALAQEVPFERQGMAFGIKQSAVPLAGLAAGLMVPFVTVAAGWRWAFVGVALAVPVASLSRGKPAVKARALPQSGGARAGPLGPLVLLAVGGGLGSAAALSLSTFHVQSVVNQGIGGAEAGILFAIGNAVGLGTRLLAGRLADGRASGHLLYVSLMMAGGSVGYLLLSQGGFGMVSIIAGTLLAFALGWGWPGLFMLSVVRIGGEAPGATAGIVRVGLAVGAVIGPIIFGLVSVWGSATAAWLTAAGMAAAASLAISVSRGLAHVPNVEQGCQP